MKRIPLIIYFMILIFIFTSCFNADLNNPNDRYSNAYVRDNAKLSELLISDGELTPMFNPDVNEYTLNISHLISSIIITPIAVNTNSDIRINNTPIFSGSHSDSISFDLAVNEILINIISEDFTESIEYKIKVCKFNNDFISFGFKSINNNSYLSEDVDGIIDKKSATITISTLSYSDISALIASFIISENANVKVGTILQTSGLTSNNFSATVIYTVTDIVPSGQTFSKNYSVTVKNGKWESYLKAPNAQPYYYHEFGYSVSISDDTIAVGAPNEDGITTTIINGSNLPFNYGDGISRGAAYIFRRNCNKWSHEAYLKPPNNTSNNSTYGFKFGTSVSISGNTVVVGAPYEDGIITTIINGSDLTSADKGGGWNGAAYVFKRNGTTWSHEAYLKSPNNSSGDLFGTSVSISADTIAVGAPWESSTTTAIINGSDLSSTNNDGYRNGAVYVFKRNDSTWLDEAYLKAPNNSSSGSDWYSYFGNSVSISEDTIAVGCPGEGSTTTTIINGSDLSSTNKNSANNGAVYIFKRYGNNWIHEAYLKSPNNSSGDLFGTSVSISGDTIVAGAPAEESTTSIVINGSDLSSTNDNGFGYGAAYVYKRNANIWSFQAYLKAPNGSQSDSFGCSVAISNNIIAVGGHIFIRNNNIWSYRTNLIAPNNTNLKYFNCSAVSISDNSIAFGVPYEGNPTNLIVNAPDMPPTSTDSYGYGAVYIFH
jgi:hypothetical protein